MTETAFSFLMIRDASFDGANIKSLKTLFWVSLEVLDHIIPRSEEQAVVVSRDALFLVPGHVAHLVDVDGLQSLTGDHCVGPLAVGSRGANLGLTEDAVISLPHCCGCFTPPGMK